MTDTRMDRRSARQRERRTRKIGDHILRGTISALGADPDDFMDMDSPEERQGRHGRRNEGDE